MRTFLDISPSVAARLRAEKHPPGTVLKGAASLQAPGSPGAQVEGCHGAHPCSWGGDSSACILGSVGKATKGAEGQGGQEKAPLRGREREEGGQRRKREGGAGRRQDCVAIGRPVRNVDEGRGLL